MLTIQTHSMIAIQKVPKKNSKIKPFQLIQISVVYTHANVKEQIMQERRIQTLSYGLPTMADTATTSVSQGSKLYTCVEGKKLNVSMEKTLNAFTRELLAAAQSQIMNAVSDTHAPKQVVLVKKFCPVQNIGSLNLMIHTFKNSTMKNVKSSELTRYQPDIAKYLVIFVWVASILSQNDMTVIQGFSDLYLASIKFYGLSSLELLFTSAGQ